MAIPITELTDTKFVKKVYSNTQSDYIEITEDKLRLILIDFIIQVKKSQDWLIPFSIFLTLLITFLTTDFSKDFLSISKTTWAIIFWLVFFASIIWLGVSLFNCLINRKTVKLDNLLETIKNKN
jgi:hypothetical protein